MSHKLKAVKKVSGRLAHGDSFSGEQRRTGLRSEALGSHCSWKLIKNIMIFQLFALTEAPLTYLLADWAIK